jgi:aerobic carbon-monoxide dehydrogenase large subunit
MKFGTSQPVGRVEDLRFVTGRGRYVGDIDLAGMGHMALVLSSHAHARIVSIDARAAQSSPGVRAVLTGSDMVADGLGGFPPLFMPEDIGLGSGGFRTLRPLLAVDEVRCVGERIACVIADTAAQARDAADKVIVTYERLPAALDVTAATLPDAPAVHAANPSNICFRVNFGDEVAVDKVFAAAHHVTSMDIRNQRLSANPIEPRAAVGVYQSAEGSYTLYCTSQNPHGWRQMIAGAVLHVPETQLRVVSPDVGGGFGVKADAYPDDALVLWAARRTGQPVKWVATRSESLATDNHARDQVVHGEIAFDARARIVGLRVRSQQAVGSYIVSAAAQPPMLAVRLTPSVYRVPAFHGSVEAIFTHTSPTSVYRGAGRPEAAFLTERLLDRAAVEMDLDPVELRRRNLIAPDQMPFSTPTGFTYDSGDFPQLLDRCLALVDWDGFAERRAQSAAKGRRRGRAVSFFIEFGGIFNDRMEIRFDPSGSVTVFAGTHSHGQGHETVFGQLLSDRLGIPREAIRYVQGDTAAVAFGRGTYAARSSLLGGVALCNAADAVVAKAAKMAAHLMEANEDDIVFENGAFSVAGTPGKAMPLQSVAKAFYAPMGITAQFGLGLDGVGFSEAAPPNFPNGCHACEVEVDPETGQVTIERYAAVDDVGRVLNETICEGQIMGGLAQGIGQALFEEVVYDNDGNLVTGSLLDYLLPTATDMPGFDLELAEIPCTTNPLGVKGVGESGTIGAPPTVMNAILDALRADGVTDLAMPASPMRVWQAIDRARSDSHHG